MLNDYDDFSSSVLDESNKPVQVEIGEDDIGAHIEIDADDDVEITPWDVFAAEPIRIGDDCGDDCDEIGGNVEIAGNVEIGEVVRSVIKTARDNRQPPPRMRAVEVDAPDSNLDDDWGLTDVFIGAASASGNPDPFPITSKLLLRFGAGTEPRFVRIDTPQTYKEFRTANSPEMSELRARVDALQAKMERHMGDPYAHDMLSEEIDEISAVGEEVKAAEQSKRVDLFMPKHFDGKLEAWCQDGNVCASLALPGVDGDVRIVTSLEPIRKCVAEIARHASESGAPASAVVGFLPAMGCVLGAGTAIKEMAAAAPAILRRPEASRKAPFIVRIEPKSNPALCALAALAQMCRSGNAQACDEWQRLATAGPVPVKQAMGEALQLIKSAA